MTILQISTDEWREHLDRGPFRIRHNLLDDARMNVEALARLVEQLPPSAVEHNLGKLPVLNFASAARQAEASPAEILRSPGFLESWMVIKNIEEHADYRDLLMTCLNDVPALADRDLAPRKQQGFVFVSANGSVTPSHCDPEENFLLQIKGTKEITIGGWPDDESKQREVDRMVRGGNRYIPFLPSEPQTFRLEPGDGVYVPPRAPHLVEVFDEPSISLSVTFRTPSTDLFDSVSHLNSWLMRLGLKPRPVRADATLDRIKASGMRAYYRASRWSR